MRSNEKLLHRLAEALNRARLPYMVIGGQAVLLHGEVRMTKDVDLTLGVPPYELSRFLQAMESTGITPRVQNPQSHVDLTHVLPCEADFSSLRADFSFTDSPYELQAIARGIDVIIDGTPVRFATAEDLVIHKVIAWRGRDIDDIRGILLKNPQLDTAYVRDWLQRFAEVLEQPLVDRFDEIWRECDD